MSDPARPSDRCAPRPGDRRGSRRQPRSSRVTEVLDIVTAIPGSVMPSQVDHSADELVARISRLDDVNDAIAFLQGLTTDERDRLARSDTPLAAFADVRTPEEALARFGALPEAQRMQVLAMFNRVDGS